MPWPTTLRKLGKRIIANWPIKVTALILSALLWAATTTQEPTTQVVPVVVQIEPPAGRALRQSIPPVRALFAGSLRELIKLYGQPPVIRKQIPDTVSGTEYTMELEPGDLTGYNNADVRPQDVQPRIITVALDEVAQRTLPIIHRVSIRPDSGFAQVGGVTVQPGSLLVRGPEARVRGLSALYTVPLEITGVEQPVRRSVRIDTTGLSPVRLAQNTVDIFVDVEPLSDRLLTGVPIIVRDPQRGTWEATPDSVTVTLRGPTNRVARLPLDSVQVVAFIEARDRDQVVRLTLITPTGITGTLARDSVRVRRRRD